MKRLNTAIVALACATSMIGCDPEVDASSDPSMEAGPQGGGKADAAEAVAPTVLLLHGYHSQARDWGRAWRCDEFWANERQQLETIGARGPVLTVGYYTQNENCDRQLDDPLYTRDFEGEITLEQGPEDGILTRDTPLEHVAYRLAWLLVDENEANPGNPVRIVTDSLGGLVVRWTVMEAALHNPNYPSLEAMGLDRVIMSGSPHEGVPLVEIGKVWPIRPGFAGDQAMQALPDSELVRTLMAIPRPGLTEWVSLTSKRTTWPSPGDGMISNESACWDQGICYRYLDPKYIHGTYMLDDDDDPRGATFEVGLPGDWSEPQVGPPAAALAARLAAGS